MRSGQVTYAGIKIDGSSTSTRALTSRLATREAALRRLVSSEAQGPTDEDAETDGAAAPQSTARPSRHST